MAEYYAHSFNTSYLAHHGIKGQKWGLRRYQNEDGSLTVEGRKRRGLSDYSIKNVPKNIKNYASKLGVKAKSAVKEKVNNVKQDVKWVAKGNPDANKPGVTKTQYSKRQMKNLTDEQLNKVLKRIQSQQKYLKYLKDSNEKKVSTKAKKTASDIFKTAVKDGGGFLVECFVDAGKTRIKNSINTLINPKDKKKEKPKARTDGLSIDQIFDFEQRTPIGERTLVENNNIEQAHRARSTSSGQSHVSNSDAGRAIVNAVETSPAQRDQDFYYYWRDY